jgi:peptidoglycan biosynthesis protein MviN/MurJ (putative lipid II flippase)
MWLTILEAAVNVVLTIALVRPYGLAGVAMGTAIPLLVSQMIAMPWYMSKGLDIPQWKWLVEGLGRPIVVGVLTFIVAQLVRRVYVPQTWPVFAAEVLVVCLVAFGLSMMLVLESGERASLREKLGV